MYDGCYSCFGICLYIYPKQTAVISFIQCKFVLMVCVVLLQSGVGGVEGETDYGSVTCIAYGGVWTVEEIPQAKFPDIKTEQEVRQYYQ
jgi:hypothetical protein